MRNRELKILTFISISIIFFMTIIAYLVSPIASLFVIVMAIPLTGLFIYYTSWRYRQIRKLSEYLRQINAGDYSLDMRDNQEGELSILKSEIYKSTRMLSEASEQLEKDKIHLKGSMSDISHQLKTPLTSMTVMADLLENPGLPQAKRDEFIHNIQTQLERTEWLVSSLLKLSKIDAGTVIFRKDTVQVADLIKKVMDAVQIRIDIKNIKVVTEGDRNATFQGDFHWTSEALINIIKNCIDHIPDESKLDIYYTENALYTGLIISDYGNGIAKEDLPHIFKRFYKGKNASEDSVGIGLAMAETIISGQNGSIDVSSEPDEGTTFHIKMYKQVI